MSRHTDFYVDFTVHPVRGDLALLTDIDAINQSVKNIVFTDRYERPWDPLFGAGIPQTLFENMTGDTQFLLETRVKEALARSEPRATDVFVYVTTTPDRNAYNCTIVYTPINSSTQVTIDAVFKRVR